MNYGLMLEIGTILSIVAVVIPVLAACGVFKSRRQRAVESALKLKLRSGSGRQSPLENPPMPAAGTGFGIGIGYDSRLRSRAKAFDTSGDQRSVVDVHSAERIQRRFRRTRCSANHSAKTFCPHCGNRL